MKTLSYLKLLFLFFLLLSATGKITAQSKQWTWVNGDTTINQYGIYDMQGVPSVINKPGARSESASWKDKAGNFWLFGGVGYCSYNSWGSLNDLWKYNPTTNEWTWLKGSPYLWANGIYGTKGVAASSNNPGARQMSASWTDNAGNLWMFGGSGANFYNDLWKFNPSTNNWTWISGDNTGNSRGVYGTQGVASPTNKPGARTNPACWTDNAGNLWMLGGNGYAASGGGGYLSDLWKYNIGSNTWTWMKGDSVLASISEYGNRNVSSPSNKPGARSGSSSWVDQSNNLWLFGGYGYASTLGILNDLWKYNTVSNEWVWVHGDNITNHSAVYGTSGIAAPSNRPGGMVNAATWVDPAGELWLFGGRGYTNTAFGELNSLWKYNVAGNQWAFIKGDFSTYVDGEYGTLGVPSEVNKPGSREEPIAWADSLGNLWMFGGESYPVNSTVTYFHNDVWKFALFNLLPVSLISFEGRLQDKNILLNWIAENEIDLDHYEIEKSFNGSTFKTIGNVKAMNKRNYGFTDHDASIPGIIYYRLKMVDKDGRFSYSNIINFKKQQEGGFVLYPNPANSYTQLRFSKNINAIVFVEIIDGAGRIISKNEYAANNNTFLISTAKIPAGSYSVRVTYNEETAVQNLIIVK